jgi:hypothetical protein
MAGSMLAYTYSQQQQHGVCTLTAVCDAGLRRDAWKSLFQAPAAGTGKSMQQQQQQQQTSGPGLPLQAASPDVLSGYHAGSAEQQSQRSYAHTRHAGDPQQLEDAGSGMTPRQQHAAAW